MLVEGHVSIVTNSMDEPDSAVVSDCSSHSAPCKRIAGARTSKSTPVATRWRELNSKSGGGAGGAEEILAERLARGLRVN